MCMAPNCTMSWEILARRHTNTSNFITHFRQKHRNIAIKDSDEDDQSQQSSQSGKRPIVDSIVLARKVCFFINSFLINFTNILLTESSKN